MTDVLLGMQIVNNFAEWSKPLYLEMYSKYNRSKLKQEVGP